MFLPRKLKITCVGCLNDGFYLILLLTLFFNTISQAQIDTVCSYQEIINYSNLENDSLYLEATETAGLFVRQTPELVANGGTILHSIINNTSWKRIINDNIYYPEWWPINPNYTTQQIQKAVDLSPFGSTVRLQTNKTYTIDRTLALKSQTHILGNNSTLRRKNTLVARLKVSAKPGDSLLVVEFPNALSIGLGIILTDTTSFFNGLHRFDNNVHEENKRPLVTAIKADTIFFKNLLKLPRSGNLDSIGYYPIGTPVFHANSMVKLYPLGADSININGVIFDGNNPTLNYDWRLFGTINLARNTSHHIFENCVFKNIPGENITLAKNSIVRNCVGRNLYGSFVHISNPSGMSDVLIENCDVDSVCLSTQEYSGHCEGAIVFSNSVQGLKLKNCNFRNGLEGIFGNMLSDDSLLIVENNSFFNFNKIIEVKVEFNDFFCDIQMRDNTFSNCGVTRVYSTGIGSISNILFHNNILNNCSFVFSQTNEVEFSYNDVSIDATSFIISSNSEISLNKNDIYSNDNNIQDLLVLANGSLRCNSIHHINGTAIIGKLNSKVSLDHNVIIAAQTYSLDGHHIIYDNYLHGSNIPAFNTSDNTYLAEYSDARNIYNSWNFTTCSSNNITSVNGSALNKAMIYPNPTSSIIKLKNYHPPSNTYYSIYTSTGKLLFSDISLTSNTISVENLSSGFYALKIIENNRTFTTVIIKI